MKQSFIGEEVFGQFLSIVLDEKLAHANLATVTPNRTLPHSHYVGC